MAAGGWPRALHGRELGAERLHLAAPQPNSGVLILDEAAQLPGAILNEVQGPIHYLDLGGIQRGSLAEFGGSPQLLAGITKLYASYSGLQSVEGLGQLAAVRWLYLDHNRLPADQLLRLPDVLPSGVRLEALDIRGNPGCTPEVEQHLLASGLLAEAQFLNGRRLQH